MVATVFPPGTDLVSICASHTIGDRKPKTLGDLKSLFLRIDTAGDDARPFFRERSTALFKAVKQATAELSPMATIEEKDRERSVQILGQMQVVAAGNLQ